DFAVEYVATVPGDALVGKLSERELPAVNNSSDTGHLLLQLRVGLLADHQANLCLGLPLLEELGGSRPQLVLLDLLLHPRLLLGQLLSRQKLLRQNLLARGAIEHPRNANNRGDLPRRRA